MATYVIRRILLIPVMLFGMTVLIFVMLSFLGPTERSALYVRDIPKNPKALEGVIKQYGLDKPIYVQYWNWLVGRQDPQTGDWSGGVIRGDFGYSRTSSQPVADIVLTRFPATLELSLYGVIPIILGGIFLGVVAAVNHNKWIDQVTRVFSIVGWSFPLFVFGLIVLMIFYAKLQWLPPGRVSDWANQIIRTPEFHSYTHLITIDALINGRPDVFWDAVKHLILPVITLSYLQWALILRVTRSSMLETLRQEYVTTARSKGLKELDVIRRHSLPNAMIPVVTVSGFVVIGLLNGVVITETIFNFPGIGKAAADAAVNLDVITILTLAMFAGIIIITANLAVDILYGFVDPRVRIE